MMTASLHRSLPAALLLATLSGGVHADIPPLPHYVAGLWFDAGHHYEAPGHPVSDPVSLYGCQRNTANCRAANAAHVVGAIVVSVNGKTGADPREVFAQPHPPNPIVVVFRRAPSGGDGGLVSVKFAPR